MQIFKKFTFSCLFYLKLFIFISGNNDEDVSDFLSKYFIVIYNF